MSSTITYHRIGLFLAFILFFLFATPTHAYFTTGQYAEALTGGGLFTIDYSFGVPNHDVYLPFATHNSSTTKEDTAVSYSILDENGNEIKGKLSAVVLSNALLEKNGMYKVAEGVAKKFTLVVVFIPDVKNPDTTYRLQVTHLPFNFDGTQQLQLNPSELQYYTTKPISL